MKKLILLVALLLSFSSYGQTAELSEESSFYLMTCSPGDDLYNTFGHTGIRVFDPPSQLNIVFNYGIFDFDTEGFYTKFLRGKLLYKLGVQTMDSFVQSYKREKRTVYQQELALSYSNKQELYRLLIENYKPENRYYKYDFFFDNCSTRPRDVIEKIPGLQWSKDESEKSYRNILDEYLVSKPWSDFGIDLIIGAVADQSASPRNRMFIPDYLHDYVSTAFIEQEALLSNEEIIIDHIALRASKNKRSWFNPISLFILLLLLEVIVWILAGKPKVHKYYDWYNKLWLLVLGIGGVAICFMWFATDHIATKSNWNLLWLHPLYLFILPVYYRQGHWIKWVCGLLVLITLLLFFSVPQQLHTAVIFILLIIFIKCLYITFAKPLPEIENSKL